MSQTGTLVYSASNISNLAANAPGNMKAMGPPLKVGEYSSLRFCIPEAIQPVITVDFLEDVYKKEFLNEEHFNWIVMEKENEHAIYSAKKIGLTGQKYKILKTTKKGYEISDIPLPAGSGSATEKLETALFSESESFYLITNPAFPKDFCIVEEKHPQKRPAMKLGLIYCRKDQVQPQDMFKNTIGHDKSGAAFQAFLSLMGKEIELTGWQKYTGDMRAPGKTYYDEWKNIEIIYHVAPLLDAGAHRGLIGNDIALIFYIEEGAEFDPSEVGSLGAVPQVFSVVQPENGYYRVAFFNKPAIREHKPLCPTKLLTANETKDLLLCKMYNGLVMSTFCPPMNRLFFTPRSATIEELVARHPIEENKQKRKKAIKDNKDKERERYLTEEETTRLFELAFHGNLKELKGLHFRSKAIRAARDLRHNNAPLIYTAARNGHEDIVKWLISHHKVDINATQTSGSTALHAAAFFGHISVVKLLLDEGADVSKKNLQGSTPIDEAKAKFKETKDFLYTQILEELTLNDHDDNRRTWAIDFATPGNSSKLPFGSDGSSPSGAPILTQPPVGMIPGALKLWGAETVSMPPKLQSTSNPGSSSGDFLKLSDGPGHHHNQKEMYEKRIELYEKKIETLEKKVEELQEKLAKKDAQFVELLAKYGGSPSHGSAPSTPSTTHTPPPFPGAPTTTTMMSTLPTTTGSGNNTPNINRKKITMIGNTRASYQTDESNS